MVRKLSLPTEKDGQSLNCIVSALILVAWVISLGYHGALILATFYGLGKHFDTVNRDDYIRFNQVRSSTSTTQHGSNNAN